MLSQTWMTVPGGTSEGCEKYVPIAVRAATNAADGWNWVALSNWYQNSLARRSPSIPGTGGNSGPGRLAASAGRVPALATAPRPAIPATASDAWRKCRRSGCLDIETPFLSRSCPRSRVIRGESGPAMRRPASHEAGIDDYALECRWPVVPDSREYGPNRVPGRGREICAGRGGAGGGGGAGGRGGPRGPRGRARERALRPRGGSRSTVLATNGACSCHASRRW